MKTEYIDIEVSNDRRETVEIRGMRQQYTEVFVETEKGFITGQMLREDGDRITVRWKDVDDSKKSVVKTVFRNKFNEWQRKGLDR